MKANEAPKKIYLQKYDTDTLPCFNRYNIHEEWTEIPVCANSAIGNDIEYTRTDYAEKEFLIKAKRFLSEIHRVCDITDENGYRIELRELKVRFEKYMKGE